jgi:hypothetical protein
MPSALIICLSPSCQDRRDCQRHWSHHDEGHSPLRSYAAFDGSQGKDGCEHFAERRDPRKRAVWVRRDGIH